MNRREETKVKRRREEKREGVRGRKGMRERDHIESTGKIKTEQIGNMKNDWSRSQR